MRNVILHELIQKDNKVDYTFEVNGKIQKYFKRNRLFFDYNHDISEVPKSILAIPFVANLAPLMWITDSKLYIEELDKSFYDCLENIKNAYQMMYPDVKFKGEIQVSNLVSNEFVPEKESAQLFSGGLDALATYVRINEKKPILITEYGWHEDDVLQNDVWEQDKKHVIHFAEEYDLENILIQSNYGNLFNAQEIDRDFLKKLGDSWWHGLHHGLAIITAAIPSAFKLKVECIYIASSYFEGYKARCASDPTVDNEIKYASGNVFHDGYDIHRQQKVKVVVDYYAQMSKKVNLRVCFLNEENCCNCEKCVRTIIGIVAEVQNPQDYGFYVKGSIPQHVSEFLEENVKFFTPARIMQWNLSKVRMKENKDHILYPELLEWFLDYDFAKERRKSLWKYRVTKLFPILRRRISNWLNQMIVQKTN